MPKSLSLILLAGVLMLGGCAAPAPVPQASASTTPMTQVPTIFVSRHMRKDEGDDPALSSAGAADAVVLAERLRNAGIAAIFVTPTRRSRETGAPVAKATGAPIETYDPRDNAALARRVAVIPGSVLIVGHSNTVPAIVAAVGGSPPGPMSEEDFGRLFAVERATGKTVETRL